MNSIALPIAIAVQRRALEGAVTERGTDRGQRRRTTRPVR